MELERYSLVRGKNPREMVLLKATPCKWGKCTFCDYIADNGTDVDKMAEENRAVLAQVTGAAGVLDVIDSASCFDLPKQTWADIKTVITEKAITHMFTECHYMYRKRLKEWTEYFGIPVTFRCGVETFDNDFRNRVLNKGAYFESPQEVAQYFSSVCLLVGIQGQTRAMIARDIAIAEELFSRACINIFTPNTTSLKPDKDLIRWFSEQYRYLESNPNIEVLWNNTDLGVG